MISYVWWEIEWFDFLLILDLKFHIEETIPEDAKNLVQDFDKKYITYTWIGNSKSRVTIIFMFNEINRHGMSIKFYLIYNDNNCFQHRHFFKSTNTISKK